MAASSETGELFDIMEVWNDNLQDEIDRICDLVDDYNYIAMDTEFPGIVVESSDPMPHHLLDYKKLKANVDILKLIQLGLTLSDKNGNLPTCGFDKYRVWQFNFREFDPDKDKHKDTSIKLLREAGLDFKTNNEKGVDATEFISLLMSSGAVLNDSVHWVTFHGAYDFGYLVKLLTGKNLPKTQAEFLKLIRIFFPNTYDAKRLAEFYGLYGGLKSVSGQLGVKRVGKAHQAGSDSLLTSCTFMKIKERFIKGSPGGFSGRLYGLEAENISNS